ncbi:type II toxin-antitoxin system YafQ family toxin [Thiospirillum jenense]|uniref:Type II toxin-antitoxin system YafQ family toxin n=1 Tax=Thiospirillum jenense TaxID=1653858 RepID=A0A839H910_9GAMM|nr:type II toxin-antitoxin system YafQ family toxin [Thiospirillum jenense]MBB1125430.1 type II toxin-antitoxin system YafQ family toxin [Thiospirillum jenense]MBB1125434.1 type II toxin-antitoxin system YafQ family toxin [Thiospirillum jenense]
MRIIKQTTQFKRDLKREAKGLHRLALQEDFIALIKILAEDESLAPKYRDHALNGHWEEYRDCHVKPDLVLIYRKPDDNTLQLVRLGSHSMLGL